MNIYGSLMNIFDQKNKDIYVEKTKIPMNKPGIFKKYF